MTRDLHPLLLSQLKALGLDAAADGAPPAGAWQALLDAVGRTYGAGLRDAPVPA